MAPPTTGSTARMPLWLVVVITAHSLLTRGASAYRFRSVSASSVEPPPPFDYVHHGEDWVQGSCSSTARQSPINFDDVSSPASGKLSYSYKTVKESFDFVNTGLAYSADLTGQGYGGITHDNNFYRLMNINFHAKSEHTFHGLHKPVEMQMVHKHTVNDALLVVAIPLDAQSSAALLPAFLQRLERTNRTNASQPATAIAAPVVDTNAFAQQRQQLAMQAAAAAGAETSQSSQATQSAQTKQVVTASTAQQQLPSADSGMSMIYQVPDAGQPNHNPTIQAFLRTEPPKYKEKVKTVVSADQPMDLNSLLQGATFLEYAGSLTQPPCTEIATWFVRREPVMVSDKQVMNLFNYLYKLSFDNGNFRSVRPLNHRAVIVRQAVEERPTIVPPDPSIPIGPNPRTDREGRALEWAQGALNNAKAARDYVDDLDTRFRNAAIAHANALAPDLMPENVHTVEEAAAAAKGAPPPPPVDMAKTAEQMAKMIANAARLAIADAAKQISIEARHAAADAAKEATKMAQSGMPGLPGSPAGAPAAR